MAHEPDLEKLLPPQDKNAEKSLLGSILRDNSTLADARQEVSAADFYSDAHQRLFRVFTDLEDSNTPIDAVTVHNAINSRGWTADIGGPAYIIELWESAPSTANAVHYAKIVREKAKLRAIIHAANEMQREALSHGTPADDIVASVSDLIFSLASGQKSRTVDWQTAMREAMECLDRRVSQGAGGEVEGAIKTGWPIFDKLTGGFHKKELVIIGARPSVGKTLLAQNIIKAFANERHNVYFASLEQNAIELLHRFLSQEGKVNSYRFRSGEFSPEEKERVSDAEQRMKNYKVWINDTAAQPLSSVISESRRIKQRYGLDLVVVDYIGLMTGEGRHSSRNEEIGRLSRGLKRLAKDLDVVVVCLAQLNRGLDSRQDKTPRLSDLRDSGEIEQDADTVIMLNKPEEKDPKRDIDLIDVLIEKQRNGPCGAVTMLHDKRFFNLRENPNERNLP